MLRVKEFQNHRATRRQSQKTAEGLGCQKTLNGCLLSIEIGAEIEAAVRRVQMGEARAKMILGNL